MLQARRDELLADTRQRLLRPLVGRERWASLLVGGSFATTAVALAVLAPWQRPPSLLAAALLVCAHALATRIPFPIGTGRAVPTQLLLVPMFFAIPAPLLPAAVACSYLLAGLLDVARGRRHRDRILVLLGSCWHVVGPALVFVAAGEPAAAPSAWRVVAAALAAQLAFDFVSSTGRRRLAFGRGPRELAGVLAWVYLGDLLLAPVAFLVALAGADRPFAFVLVLPLLGLLALLAREREARSELASAIDGAYRQATREARLDPLTRIGNRLAWEEALVLADARRAATGDPVALVLVDLDNLKPANDERGHDFGDRLLREAASLLQAAAGPSAAVARIGGDEFALMLEGADPRACARTVDRIRSEIAAHPGLDGFRLAASVGAACCPPERTLSEAQKLADLRLYACKDAGRSGGSRGTAAHEAVPVSAA